MGDPHNLVIDQGATFRIVVALEEEDGTVVDLTGASARMMARKHYKTPNPPALDLTGDVDGSAGEVTLELTPAQTRAVAPDMYLYDVEVTYAGGDVDRVLEGRVEVTAEVTK